jgi:hypothetical protein
MATSHPFNCLTKPLGPEELRARVHVGPRVLTLQERLSKRVIELESALAKVNELHASASAATRQSACRSPAWRTRQACHR